MLVDLANHARSLDRQLSLARAAATDTDTSPSTAVSPSASYDTLEPEAERNVPDSIDSLAQELSKVSITHSKRHFGKSSNFMLIQSAMDARRDVLGDLKFTTTIFVNHQRPEFWKPFPWQIIPPRSAAPPFVFPEDDLLHDLVHIYFSNLNPLFPLLHQPTFERSIAEGLHSRDRSFGATVLAVCAVASRQSNDPRNFCEGTTSAHSLGWRWFCQVPLVRESFTEPPSLYDLQLCSLSVFYLQTTSTPEAAWVVVGIGIRSAQEMGIHTRNSHHRNPVENELWKRAFWTLISIDVFMSAFVGRPRATTPDDFDVDLPIECDDEYWEIDDPQKAFVQPEGKPSVLSFFVTFLKLLDIVGFAQRTLYAVRKSELWSGMGVSGIDFRRKAVMELDSALNKFLDTIPNHLRWNSENPDPVFFQQSAMLYATYYWVQIQVHRPFIPRPGQESVLPFPSLTICSNAARATVNMLEILHSRREMGMVALEIFPNTLTPLFASALILLVNIWRPKRGYSSPCESAKEMTDVYRCLKLIQNHESRYQTAGRILDLLNAVITIGQLPKTRELKRPRSPGDEEERRPAPVPSHAQRVLEDLHDVMHSGRSSYSKPESSTPTTLSWNDLPIVSQTYSGVGASASSSSSPASYTNVVQDRCGIFNPDPIQLQPQPINTDFTGLAIPIGGDDPQMFVNPAASQFVLQPGGLPDLMGDTALTSEGSGNVDFTQEDWDSFMASVGDLVTGTMEYSAF
ncbi:hypothetical protein E1B28_002713 [Marasmius oreades]|nr:uncharacterized protein E1B28_002713 [Marasmius oreades]KAG7086785.1 hypothetical protein E1B28_002713 [Marasmius oreades]